MPDPIIVGGPIEYACANGGTVYLLGGGSRLRETAHDDGWAVFDDLALNADTNMSLDLSGGHVSGEVRHTTGETVMTFDLTSRQPNGTTDIRLTGLRPGGWYRLHFDGVLARTAGGTAHGKASPGGVLGFTAVEVPS